jgi:hypothetical protein
MIRPATSRKSSPSRCLGGIRDRRGVVAVLVGLMAPVLVMALGLGIEVSRWSVAKVELQRTADAAALAGAFDYLNQTTPVQQTAIAAAVNLAQINGITAPVTAQIVTGLTGLKNPSDNAMKVTVSRQLPLFLAGIFTAAPSLTISAIAVAEMFPTSVATGTACVLALQGDTTGITTDLDIDISNGVSVNTTNNCALRSDGDIDLTGGVNIGTAGAKANVIAAGSATVENGATVNGNVTAGSISVTATVTGSVAAPAPGDITVNNGGKVGSQITAPNPGQGADPFAQDTTLQTALQNASSTLSTTSETNCNTGNGGVSCTISPGNYSTINFTGNGDTLTLNPGLYTVNGPVNFTGGTVNFVAGGVTIVSSGAINVSNGVKVQTTTAGGSTTPGVSAATSASATGGAIPGVLFATNSSGNAVTFGGGAQIPFSGLIYAPNGTLTINNGVSAPTLGCAEVVASVVALAGGANFDATACTQAFGLTNIPSQTSTTETAALVQ